MSRYEQRKKRFLQDPEVAAGYWAMDAELKIMHALEAIRQQRHMTQEALAERMGRKREAISRLLSSDDANPTLETLIELLSALDVTADITIRPSLEGESPLKVAVEL